MTAFSFFADYSISLIPMKKIILTLLAAVSPLIATAEQKSPNVLFISVDDLNDWIGCMGGNPQSITPNFDRLAASGMLFTNAHCIAPACNPSRTALMTGLSPHKTGVYDNRQNMRDVLPDEKIIPEYFADNGYWSAGSGKILHYFTHAQAWDEYYPEKSTENPIPETLYPEVRPLTLKRGGPWQYIETDWGPLKATDKEFGGDYTVSEWVGNQLSKEHEKPFFLACGIYRPHEPWFVPQKYFDKFPLDSIKLPPAYKENDLDDLTEARVGTGQSRYFTHIQKEGQWKKGIQGYLASINFADTMLGRVLDSLENGPNKDNTIVVLWSDHGWHLGSKERWQKYTAWRQATRVPLMVKIPKGISNNLPEGTTAGTVYDHPVSLISLFPTLTDLCDIAAKPGVHGNSLLPILKDPSKPLDDVAITYLATVGSVGISGKDWRYIRYADKSEELYNIKEDPYEWDNLSNDPKYAQKLADFRKHIPTEFVPKPGIKVADLLTLSWHPHSKDSKVPASFSNDQGMRLAVVNKTSQTIKLNRISKDGSATFVTELKAGDTAELKSAAGTSWTVTDTADQPLGHFTQGDRMAKAVIPE